MKSLFDLLIPKDKSKTSVNDIRLEFVRFRKLLENSRALMSLMEDAEEKMRGEYIFDRQYVLSLIDESIEYMSMAAFDLSVIAQDASEMIYGLVDELKAFTQTYFIERKKDIQISSPFIDLAKTTSSEPEFVFLAQVLAWMKGPLPNGNVSVTEFVRQVFDKAVPALKKADMSNPSIHLKKLAHSTLNCFHLIDMDEAVKSKMELSIHELKCRPLITMLTSNATANHSIAQESADAKWLALMEHDRLSLRGIINSRDILIEVTQSGYMDADFMFMFISHPLISNTLFPQNFKTLMTDKAIFGWSYHLSDYQIEQSLTHIGTSLFN
ncbi:MAG: hypothetical protein HQK77_22025 [Desulfobacterales bacterium]|nr:hypothetical protein [Desulfobacterales bacterium]